MLELLGMLGGSEIKIEALAQCTFLRDSLSFLPSVERRRLGVHPPIFYFSILQLELACLFYLDGMLAVASDALFDLVSGV